VQRNHRRRNRASTESATVDFGLPAGSRRLRRSPCITSASLAYRLAPALAEGTHHALAGRTRSQANTPQLSQNPATHVPPSPKSSRGEIVSCNGRLEVLIYPTNPVFVLRFSSPIVDVEAPPRRTPNSNNKADRRLPLTPCCALGDHERSLVTSWKMLPLSWNVERLSRNGRGVDEGLRNSRSPTPSRSRGMDSACSRRMDAASRIGCARLAHRLRLALAERTPPHSRRTDGT
jgi:hypothetical protein